MLEGAAWRTVAVADIPGIRAFAVHAKDSQARASYQRFDFIVLPTDPLHLFLPIKEVRRSAPPPGSTMRSSGLLILRMGL